MAVLPRTWPLRESPLIAAGRSARTLLGRVLSFNTAPQTPALQLIGNPQSHTGGCTAPEASRHRWSCAPVTVLPNKALQRTGEPRAPSGFWHTPGCAEAAWVTVPLPLKAKDVRRRANT